MENEVEQVTVSLIYKPDAQTFTHFVLSPFSLSLSLSKDSRNVRNFSFEIQAVRKGGRKGKKSTDMNGKSMFESEQGFDQEGERDRKRARV